MNWNTKKHAMADMLPSLDLYTTEQTSVIVGRSPAQLFNDRKAGRGIPWIKTGPKAIRYRLDDIMAWLARNRVSTSDQ